MKCTRERKKEKHTGLDVDIMASKIQVQKLMQQLMEKQENLQKYIQCFRESAKTKLSQEQIDNVIDVVLADDI